MQDFGRIFDGVEDPRTGNATRHDLHEMLVIALLCMIRGTPRTDCRKRKNPNAIALP